MSNRPILTEVQPPRADRISDRLAVRLHLGTAEIAEASLADVFGDELVRAISDEIRRRAEVVAREAVHMALAKIDFQDRIAAAVERAVREVVDGVWRDAGRR